MRPRLRASSLSEEGGQGRILGASWLSRARGSHFISGDGVSAGTHLRTGYETELTGVGAWEVMKLFFLF